MSVLPRRSGSPDPKPPKRVVASLNSWESLRYQKLGPCRICGKVPATLHHLVPRSLRGDDVAENLVPLCGHGTQGCHGDVEAHRPEAVAALRQALRPEELKYILTLKGSVFLERYYGVDL